MGWCPAHDTNLKGVLAELNMRADKLSKQARAHTQGIPWTMPQAWVDGHTFAWHCRGRRVMGIKQAVRDTLDGTHRARTLPHESRDRMCGG